MMALERSLALGTKMTIMTSVTNGGQPVKGNTWTIAEAKAKFSEVIDRARSGEPQTITRHRRAAVVVVSAEEWERKVRRKGSLVDFFSASPLPASGLKGKRLKDRPREIDL